MRRWFDELGMPAGLAALIVLAGAMGYYLIKSDFDLVARGLTALGILLLAFFFYANSSAIRGRVGVRQLRYGSNTFVMVAALIGILVLANMFVARNSQRWDLTASKSFSLSDQTAKVLAGIKEPIKVTGFFSDQDSQKQQVQDLLKEYTVKSDKISTEFIDPDMKPAEAQKYQIKDYGTLVFQSGSRRQDTTGSEESDITSAILKVSSGEQKKVAFLTGHGESAIDNSDRNGYSQIEKVLEQNNYQVTSLNLTTNPTLTTDISVLIVASPHSALLDQEKNAIKSYLDEGGHMLLLGDPQVEANLNDVIAKWGIEMGKGIAVDPQMAFYGDVGTLVVQQYRYSPITKDLRSMAILPLATNVQTKNPAPDGVTYTPLFDITDKGWVEMDTKVAQYDEGVDIKGPSSIAVAVEDRGKDNSSESQPRLVVIGDSDFASNSFMNMGANPDIFVNSVNWLAQSEQVISITPKQPDTRQLVLTGGEGNFVLFSSAALLPGLVILTGAVVWWKRR